MIEYRKEFKRYTIAVANCGRAIRVYEGVKCITEIAKDEAHIYLTENDFSLVKQVYASIKDLERRRKAKQYYLAEAA